MRENGYYWVKPRTAHEPFYEVAEWCVGNWQRTGTWELFYDADFDEIDENRITRIDKSEYQKNIQAAIEDLDRAVKEGRETLEKEN